MDIHKVLIKFASTEKRKIELIDDSVEIVWVYTVVILFGENFLDSQFNLFYFIIFIF